MLFTECGKLPDMIVRFAEDIDLDKAVEMYDEIIDDTEGKAESPKWTKGIYPEREYLCNAIRNRELMRVESYSIINALLAMNMLHGLWRLLLMRFTRFIR